VRRSVSHAAGIRNSICLARDEAINTNCLLAGGDYILHLYAHAYHCEVSYTAACGKPLRVDQPHTPAPPLVLFLLLFPGVLAYLPVVDVLGWPHEDTARFYV
jgi:hypothetical protein